MNENEIVVTEVDQGSVADPETRRELITFAALIVVFLITFMVIALVAPMVGRVVPAVLGLDRPAAPTQLIPVDTEESSNDTSQPDNDTPRPVDNTEVEQPDDNVNNNNDTEGQPNDDNAQQEETIAPTPRLHIVEQGQNLTIIAQQYGVAVEAIIQANNLNNPNRIEAGMTLVIP